uniref:Transmembrane protein n=1 Tax=Angiostrongylus cantonensis TaxID=6313 RepID=A0A0K0CZS4_ANGCA
MYFDHIFVDIHYRANVYAYMYKTVFVSSIAFVVAGIVLTVFSLLSPTWQITKRPKTAEIHHHGLWWDCVVSDGTLIPLGREKSSQQSEKCVSKFNPAVQSQLKAVLENGDAFSKELLSHRFLPHHKSVIFFSAFTLVFGAIGVITGACSPCFPPNSLLFVVSSFMTGACSLLSDVIFILGTANTVTTVKEPSHLEGAGGEVRNELVKY